MMLYWVWVFFKLIKETLTTPSEMRLTVKNGPNVGSKFYGCPLWPDTKCEIFKLIDGNNDVEGLQVQLLENTTIAEMEVVQKLKDDKIKKLQKKKGSLEGELNGLKCEMSKLKVDMVKENTVKANLQLALVICLDSHYNNAYGNQKT
ncbi:Endonuclease 8-like 3 [Bienertia sinuspersici]